MKDCSCQVWGGWIVRSKLAGSFHSVDPAQNGCARGADAATECLVGLEKQLGGHCGSCCNQGGNEPSANIGTGSIQENLAANIEYLRDKLGVKFPKAAA